MQTSSMMLFGIFATIALVSALPTEDIVVPNNYPACLCTAIGSFSKSATEFGVLTGNCPADTVINCYAKDIPPSFVACPHGVHDPSDEAEAFGKAKCHTEPVAQAMAVEKRKKQPCTCHAERGAFCGKAAEVTGDCSMKKVWNCWGIDQPAEELRCWGFGRCQGDENWHNAVCSSAG